ncbi:hypothetical protein [Ferruginibacter sp.]
MIAFSGVFFLTAVLLFAMWFRSKKKRLLLFSLLSFMSCLVFTLWTFLYTAKQVYTKTENIIAKKLASDTADSERGYNLFVDYDIDKPDTKSNRERFKDYLKIDINENVKEVFCYADFLGADYKIQMSFKCDTATVNKIISVNKLYKQDFRGGRNLDNQFPWWNEKRIDSIRPYIMSIEDELYKFLWFDPQSGKAYYLEYSL